MDRARTNSRRASADLRTAARYVIQVTVLPVLFAESTPAPAGVGAMLLLLVVGLGILFASFVRSSAELFVYPSSRNSA